MEVSITINGSPHDVRAAMKTLLGATAESAVEQGAAPVQSGAQASATNETPAKRGRKPAATTEPTPAAPAPAIVAPTEPVKPAEPAAPAPAELPKAAEPAPAASAPVDPAKPVTEDQLRAALSQVNSKKGTLAVKELLDAVGAARLSAVPAEKRAELLEKANALLAAVPAA